MNTIMTTEGLNKKRSRSKNFTATEVNILVEEFKVRGEVLSAKHCSGGANAVTRQIQDAVWRHITSAVNSAGVCTRTTEEVKEKWRNMQRKAKSEYTAERVHTLKTGGGPPLPLCSSQSASREMIDMMKDRSSFSGIPGADGSESVIVDFRALQNIQAAAGEDFAADMPEPSLFGHHFTFEAAPDGAELPLSANATVHISNINVAEGREDSRPSAVNQEPEPEAVKKEIKGRKRTLKELQMEFYENEIMLQGEKRGLINKQAETLGKLDRVLDMVLEKWTDK